MERLEHLSDIAIKLESFAGSAKETNPLFKDYHGLLHIKKLPALNILAPHTPESRDLVFKLRRKKFIIEVNTLINLQLIITEVSNNIYKYIYVIRNCRFFIYHLN